MNFDPALNLIKKWEGCSLKSYKDMIGIWTIGYGQTGDDIKEGLEITQEKADIWLLNKLYELSFQLDKAMKVSVSDNQFCALLSLIYNIGIGNFRRSSLLSKLNDGADFDDIAEEFLKWNRAGGHLVEGLTNRRKEEKELFLSQA